MRLVHRSVRSRWLTAAVAAAVTTAALITATGTAGAAADTLLSQGKPVAASSTEKASTPPSAAVDGNTATRWSSSFADPQWIRVDLGATAAVNRIVLQWEGAYARAYQIQVSADAAAWTTIYSTTTGTGRTQTVYASGNARYVRMLGTSRATAYGYSLWEFQVYGTVDGGGGGIPNPTAQSLEAAGGPLATADYVVPNPVGYKAGTITYPTAPGSYPGIVLMPGNNGTQANLSWLAPRLASWGFVVINVDTLTLTDDPGPRGTQVRAAGTQIIDLSNAAGNPISGKVNGTLGVAGHSKGGGATMVALRDDSRFRAGAPLAPWYPGQSFPTVDKPTFFLTCASDPVANGDTYARPWYNGMSRAEKLLIEVPGDHLCPMTGNGDKAKQGKWLVSFFSRWLRDDARFAPFLCGAPRDADRTNPSVVTEWTDTCPF